MIKQFSSYPMTVVKLSGSRRPEEFNLQFTRLNLGTIINSGEKLHAMVGDMRDVCFEADGFGAHQFLNDVSIPTRRFSREQTAAQILAQVFSLKRDNVYTRTRHFDLQKFFKDYGELTEAERQWVGEVRRIMDALAAAFKDPGILRNRAITVSTVLLALKRGATSRAKATNIARFMEDFLCRLRWQVNKGLDVDPEYRYLIDFQRHVTQASVERPAVEARAATLEEQLALWEKKDQLTGDAPYRARTKSNPAEDCKKK